ncbi:MAG: hypothetical protein IKT09_05630 [Synergistes sp.]|nr:hypothetical protein [Synergistes sp.]
MKKIKIFYSEYGSEDVQEYESEDVRVNLSSLEEFYSKLGEKHLLSFRKFADFWETDGCERLFRPQAVIKTMPAEVLSAEFKGVPELEHKEEKTALLVWTIGDELEKEASRMTSAAGSIMTGLLLDVAGSISLYSMHGVLIGWLRNKEALSGRFVCGEYYPGIGNMRQDLMEKVVSCGATETLINVTASGTSLLCPRKSQCAFAALGQKEGACEIKTEPCRPCKGKKCLYYQLGGCHMMYSEKR